MSSNADRTSRQRSGAPPPVIEVMGLPGVGKTEACEALLTRLGGRSRRSWIADRSTQLRRSFVPKAALPITLLRYRRLIHAMRGRSNERWVLARTVRTLLSSRSGGLWRSKDALVSSLFMLTVTVSEIALARMEARLRGRMLITDEGFVHRALGIWIRSEPAIREEAMAAYLETIPPGSRCILLRCDPETARDRAMTRARGIPTAMMRAAKAIEKDRSRRAEAIAEVYSRQAAVFELAALRSRIELHEVDASGSPEEIADEIAKSLDRFGVDGRTLIFLRTSPNNLISRRSKRA